MFFWRVRARATVETTVDLYLQVSVEQLARILEYNEHSRVGRDSAQQARTEAAKEPPPASLVSVQFSRTVDDATELALRVFQLVGLQGRLDDVSGVRERPVSKPGGTPADELAGQRQITDSRSRRRQQVTTQLVET